MSIIHNWNSFYINWQKNFGGKEVTVDELLPLAAMDIKFGRGLKNNPSKTAVKKKKKALITALQQVAAQHHSWGQIRIRRNGSSQYLLKIHFNNTQATDDLSRTIKVEKEWEEQIAKNQAEPQQEETVMMKPEGLTVDTIWKNLSNLGVKPREFSFGFGIQANPEQQAVMELIHTMKGLSLSNEAIAKMLEHQALKVEGLEYTPESIQNILNARTAQQALAQ